MLIVYIPSSNSEISARYLSGLPVNGWLHVSGDCSFFSSLSFCIYIFTSSPKKLYSSISTVHSTLSEKYWILSTSCVFTPSFNWYVTCAFGEMVSMTNILSLSSFSSERLFALSTATTFKVPFNCRNSSARSLGSIIVAVYLVESWTSGFASTIPLSFSRFLILALSALLYSHSKWSIPDVSS